MFAWSVRCAYVVGALFVACSILPGQAARAADMPAATPAPSVSPAAEAPDPCGGDARLLATLNRPTIGFSTCAVKKGTTVFEIGYQNSTVTGAGAGNAVQYTQDYTRIGVRDRFELDVLAPNLNKVTSAGAFTHGYADAGLGLKYEFVPKGKFTYGVDGIFTAPTGTTGFTAGGPGYTGNLNASYAASPAIAFGTTLAFSSLSGFAQSGAQARFSSFMPSFVVTAQIPNFYQFYLEYVYNSKVAPDLGYRATIDYGVQKLLGRNLEIDLEVGQSVNAVAGARSHYIGVGFGLQL